MRTAAKAVLVSALAGLLLAAGGEGRAGNDPPAHPALSDCQDVWDDGSAKASCSSANISTGPGKCVIRATCKASPRYAGDGYTAASFPRDGCIYTGSSTGTGSSNLRFYFECNTTVEFSPENTDSVTNCDGELRRGSSC